MLGMNIANPFAKRSTRGRAGVAASTTPARDFDFETPPLPPPKHSPPLVAPWNKGRNQPARTIRSSPLNDTLDHAASSSGPYSRDNRDREPDSLSLTLTSSLQSPTSPTFSVASQSSASHSGAGRAPPSSYAQDYTLRSGSKTSTPAAPSGSARTTGSMLKNMRSWKGASSASLVSSTEGDREREPRVTIPPGHAASVPSDPSPIDKTSSRGNLGANTSAVAAFAAEKMFMFGRLAVGKVRAAASHAKHKDGYGSESDNGRGSSGEHRRYLGSDSQGSQVSLSGYHDDRHGAPLILPSAGGLGVLLRPPLPRSSGRVFGRDLVACVRDTRAHSSFAIAPDMEPVLGNLAGRPLEKRAIPALLLRCARHIEKWGLDEEGLFRISGRSTHMSKLRSEFDAGADWDLVPLSPADLDPHSVAGIFKAYFRELPEPVLTRALGGLFDAALYAEEQGIDIEEHTKDFKGDSGVYQNNLLRGMGVGLPTGQRGRSATVASVESVTSTTRQQPKMIKPEHVRHRSRSHTGPSQSLIDTLISLILRLPTANLDVLTTLIELIRATSDIKRVRHTKMPLGNLLLVFCPSLGVTPSVMRVLCESDHIWDGVRERRAEMDAVLDISSRPSSAGNSEEAIASAPPNPPVEQPRPRGPKAQSSKRIPVPALLDLNHSVDHSETSSSRADFETQDLPKPRRSARQHRPQMSLDANAYLSQASPDSSSSAKRPAVTRNRSQSSAAAIGMDSRQSSTSSWTTASEWSAVPSSADGSSNGSDNRTSVITVTQSPGRLSIEPTHSTVQDVPEDHEEESSRSARSSLSSSFTSSGQTHGASSASTPVSDVSNSHHPLDDMGLNIDGEEGEEEKRKTLIAIPRSPRESITREPVFDSFEEHESPMEEAGDIKMLRQLKELSESEMDKRGLQSFSNASPLPSPLPSPGPSPARPQGKLSREMTLRHTASLRLSKTSDFIADDDDQPSPAHSLPPPGSSERESKRPRLPSLMALKRKSADLTTALFSAGLPPSPSFKRESISAPIMISQSSTPSSPPKLSLPFDDMPSSPIDLGLLQMQSQLQLFGLLDSSSTSTLTKPISIATPVRPKSISRSRSSPSMAGEYILRAKKTSKHSRANTVEDSSVFIKPTIINLQRSPTAAKTPIPERGVTVDAPATPEKTLGESLNSGSSRKIVERASTPDKTRPPPTSFIAPVITQSVSSPPVVDYYAPDSPTDTEWAQLVMNASESGLT